MTIETDWASIVESMLASLRDELKSKGLPESLASSLEACFWLEEGNDDEMRRLAAELPPETAAEALERGEPINDDGWSNEVRALPCQLSCAAQEKATVWPLHKKIQNWGDALDQVFGQHKAVHNKGGGIGVTQGSVATGKPRQIDYMVRVCGLFLDIESGDEPNDVEAAVRREGWAAVITSSYSHLKTTTEIPNKKLEEFMKREGIGLPISDGAVRRYLIEEKGIRPVILEGMTVREGEGFTRIAEHKPLPRFRVILPLAKPFVLKEHGENGNDANEAWGGFYRAVARKLRVQHDRSCEDVTRFMWSPEHPWGTNIHFTRVINGAALDLTKIAVEKGTPAVAKTKGNGSSNSGSDNHTTKRLREFERAGGLLTLDICKMGEAAGLQLADRPRGGVMGECPDADNHTVKPNEDWRGGSWGYNHGQNPDAKQDGAAWHCSHDCHDGKHPLFFVDKLCQAIGIEDAGKLAAEYCDPPFELLSIEDRIAKLKKGDGKAAAELAAEIGTDTELLRTEKATLLKKAAKAVGARVDDLRKDSRAAAKKRNNAEGSLPCDCYAKDGKIWYQAPPKFDGDALPPEPVCDPFEITALKRDAVGDDWGFVVEFKDRDTGAQKQVTVSAKRFHSNAQQVIADLGHAGLWVQEFKPTKDILARLLSNLADREGLPRIVEVNRPGWHKDGEVYVTPTGEVIGAEDYRLAKNAQAPNCTKSGTIEGSKAALAAAFKVKTNFYWGVAACAGFAGVVVQIAGEESGGVAFVGESFVGKTLGQAVQASAFGNPDPKNGGPCVLYNLDSTTNAMEGLARVGTGSTLALDEKASADPKLLEGLVFKLSSGSERQRQMRDANTNRKTIGWSISFTLSSERTTEQMKKLVLGGETNRCPQIDCTGGVRLAPGDPIIKDLEGCKQHYGLAGPEFVREFIRHGYNTPDGCQRLKDDLNTLTGEIAGEWVEGSRAARKFAVLLWCGEFARKVGLFPPDAPVREFIMEGWKRFAESGASNLKNDANSLRERLCRGIADRWNRTIVPAVSDDPRNGSSVIGSVRFAGDIDGYYDDQSDPRRIFILYGRLGALTGGIHTDSAVAAMLYKEKLLIPKKANGSDKVHPRLPWQDNVKNYRIVFDGVAPEAERKKWDDEDTVLTRVQKLERELQGKRDQMAGLRSRLGDDWQDNPEYQALWAEIVSLETDLERAMEKA